MGWDGCCRTSRGAVGRRRRIWNNEQRRAKPCQIEAAHFVLRDRKEWPAEFLEALCLVAVGHVAKEWVGVW